MLAIAMPGPLELIILLVAFLAILTFIGLLFRFLWRAGSVRSPSDHSGRIDKM